MARPDFESVSAYISAQPKPVQKVLKQVRSILKRALPKADEVISYQIPTYKEHGKAVIFFAGFSEHYSIYPVTDALTKKLGKQIDPFRSGRGTLRFELTKPVPSKLIERIAKLRSAENAASATLKRKP